MASVKKGLNTADEIPSDIIMQKKNYQWKPFYTIYIIINTMKEDFILINNF